MTVNDAGQLVGQLRPEIKEKWLAALRSGDYRQGKGRLSDVAYGSERTYCCLGVLCKLAAEEGIVTEEIGGYVISYGGAISVPPPEVAWWAFVDHDFLRWNTDPWVLRGNCNLPSLNDDGVSFARIADLIEEQL